MNELREMMPDYETGGQVPTIPLQGTTKPATLINNETCIHHWVLEPVGLQPKGTCKKCGKSRVHTNALYDKPGYHKPTAKEMKAANADYEARLFQARSLGDAAARRRENR
jgi:hypothetical protein